MTGRGSESGFTLIETLVALAVLAVSAVAILGATEAHVARIGSLEARAAALWAAENRLSEAALGLDGQDRETLLGFDVVTVVARSPTADADLERLQVTATAQDLAVRVRLEGFVASPVTEP